MLINQLLRILTDLNIYNYCNLVPRIDDLVQLEKNVFFPLT